MSEGKTLIFLHIYKTAGTTLDMIISRQFPQDSIFTIDGRSAEIAQECINRLKRLPEKERARIRYLRRHLSFGLHEYLPQPCTYVTLLRNPVERVISAYYNVLRYREHWLYSEVTSKNISLEDFVRNGMWETWNGQTHRIRGVPVGSVPAMGSLSLSSDDLEIAKTNLREHFLLVGLSERFDESLILLKRALGWRTKDILYIKQYLGWNRPPEDEITADTIKLIESYNELDIQLYEFAKQMFEERICEQDSSFRRELQTFRLCNKVYGLIINNRKLYRGPNLLLSGMAKVKATARKYRQK